MPDYGSIDKMYKACANSSDTENVDNVHSKIYTGTLVQMITITDL